MIRVSGLAVIVMLGFRTIVPAPGETVVQAYYGGAGRDDLVACWPEDGRMRAAARLPRADSLAIFRHCHVDPSPNPVDKPGSS